MPLTQSALCKAVSVGDTTGPGGAQMGVLTPGNPHVGITIPWASKASCWDKLRDFPGGDFYNAGVKVTGCPRDLTATWGKPGVWLTQGRLSFCSLLMSPPHCLLRIPFMLIHSSRGGGGQVAGSLSGMFTLHHKLLGCPQNLTSGCNFPFLIIWIPGNELSCHRLQGIFPPGLKLGPRKRGHTEGILFCYSAAFSL